MCTLYVQWSVPDACLVRQWVHGMRFVCVCVCVSILMQSYLWICSSTFAFKPLNAQFHEGNLNSCDFTRCARSLRYRYHFTKHSRHERGGNEIVYIVMVRQCKYLINVIWINNRKFYATPFSFKHSIKFTTAMRTIHRHPLHQHYQFLLAHTEKKSRYSSMNNFNEAVMTFFIPEKTASENKG